MPPKPPASKLDPRLTAFVEEFDGAVANVAPDDGAAGQLKAERIAAKAPFSEGDKIAVAIRTAGGAGPVARTITGGGGRIANSDDEYLEAYVPLAFLPRLDANPTVASVEMITPGQPALVGQGFTVHNVALWQSAGLTGAGVKVGIIDNSFKGFAGLMGTELPATVVARCYTAIGTYTSDIADCGNNGSHGTAVAESLIDIAPDVELYISEPGSRADLRSTVEWMVAQGVRVISHSVIWPWEGYGDGTSPYADSVLGSVDTAVAGNAVWVSSAGNDASKSWYGTYVDSDADGFIEFQPGTELAAVPLSAGQGFFAYARWDGTWLGTERDLAIYMFDTDGTTVLDSSYEVQNGGTSKPSEGFFLSAPANGTYYLGILDQTPSDPPTWVQWKVWNGPAPSITTSVNSIAVPGESANPGMLAVGAVDFADTSTIEYFSSRGPTVDGRIKPEVVAANRGDTVTLGSFAGTSQSAPYVAGIAALVRQRYPSFGPVETAQWIKDDALPRGTGTPNNDFGWGLAYLPEAEPDAPTNAVAAVGPGSGEATVTWTAPAWNGGAAVTGYTVTSSPGGITSSVGGATLSAVVTGLTPGTPYTFTVTATNTAGSSGPSPPSNQVTPTGNSPPNTVDDSYSVGEDGTLVVDALSGVLANDSDPQGDPMTAAQATGPASGSLTLNADGSFTYTPTGDFNGADSFTYVASDGSATSAPATVTVTVDPVNDAPSFTKGPDQIVSPAGGPQSVPGWAGAISAGPPDESTQAVSFLVTNDNNALFTAQPAISAAGTLTYQPSPSANGGATVSVQAQDDGGTTGGGTDTSPVQTFTVTVGPTVSGTVTLQGVATGSAEFATIGPSVTLTPDGPGAPTTVAIAGDGTFSLTGVAAGTYTITASADGFQPGERTGLVIGSLDIAMPQANLAAGMVNSDSTVDGADLSLVAGDYGMSTADRTDGSGNWVDLNADGAVSALDISPVIANVGLSGMQAW